MANNIWDAERDALLCKLWVEGYRTLDIAARMGTTKNAIIGRAHRMSLPKRASPIRRPEGWIKPPPKPRVLRMGPPPAPRAPVQAVRAVEPKISLVGGCRWPLWGTGAPSHRYCDAARAAQNVPYCSKHCAVAYRPAWVRAA